MTSDATSPLKDGMDCARVAQEDILEGYLLGKLSEEDRDAFEEHYFECARCFDELTTLRAMREELGGPHIEPESTTRRLLVWRAAAYVATPAIVLLGLALWLREPRSAPRETTLARTSSQPHPKPAEPAPIGTNGPSKPTIEQPPQIEPSPHEPSTPRRPLRRPAHAPGETTATQTASQAQAERAGPRSAETTGASDLTIERLARVEPASYQPDRLRGPVDEATQRFRRGMEQYVKGDFANAVEDLRVARTLDPNGAHISFFLGVSELMLGHVAAAIGSLQRTIALGDSPYLEDAHFYLAKALLQIKHVPPVGSVYARGGALAVATDGVTLDPAEVQFREVIKLRGPRSEEAKRLLAEIERLKRQ